MKRTRISRDSALAEVLCGFGLLFIASIASVGFMGCGGSSTRADAGGSGGMSGSGGAQGGQSGQGGDAGQGGSGSGSGGASPSGGASGSGGRVGTGGAVGTGGRLGTGGNSSTGGGGAGGSGSGGKPDAGSDAAPVCICPANYAPVCGVNGKTYSNACGAQCENIAIAHDGVCAAADASTDGKLTLNAACDTQLDACAAGLKCCRLCSGTPPTDGGTSCGAPACMTAVASACPLTP